MGKLKIMFVKYILELHFDLDMQTGLLLSTLKWLFVEEICIT